MGQKRKKVMTRRHAWEEKKTTKNEAEWWKENETEGARSKRSKQKSRKNAISTYFLFDAKAHITAVGCRYTAPPSKTSVNMKADAHRCWLVSPFEEKHAKRNDDYEMSGTHAAAIHG